MLTLKNEESFATIIYPKRTNSIIKIYDYVNFSWGINLSLINEADAGQKLNYAPNCRETVGLSSRFGLDLHV